MYTGPHLIKDSLVFGYDTGYGVADNNTSTRFYKGEPGANLWDSMLNTQSLRTHTKHYWDGNRWTENSTYTHPGVSGPIGTYLGLVFKHVSGALSSSWGSNSYGYMLRDIACTNGATMTMSSWIYASADCNLDSIPAVIEGEAGGESLVSGFPGEYNLNNKGTWQVTAKKATSDGNTRFIPLYPRKNGVTNGSFTGFFMWALPQVTYGNNVIPPIQPGSTRLSTQSLIDLKRTTSIDVSNVSFDSTGQPDLDGTGDYFQTTTNCGITDSITLEAVFNEEASSAPHTSVICTDTDHQRGVKLMSYKNSNRYGLWLGFGTSSYVAMVTGTLNNDTKYHLVGTWKRSTGVVTIYLNGELQETISTGQTASVVLNTGKITIGAEYHGLSGSYGLNGQVYVGKVYNGVLSADQVKQNFNVYKNRFGI